MYVKNHKSKLKKKLKYQVEKFRSTRQKRPLVLIEDKKVGPSYKSISNTMRFTKGEYSD